MKFEEIVKQLGEQFLPLIEAKAKELVEANSDKVVELLMAKLKELIPGQIDDMIINQFSPALKAYVKEQLLNQVDHIS